MEFTGKHAQITEKIIGAYYTVYSALGCGFLEKVYKNALAIELRKNGCAVKTQEALEVYYGGQRVGEYFAKKIRVFRVYPCPQ